MTGFQCVVKGGAYRLICFAYACTEVLQLNTDRLSILDQQEMHVLCSPLGRAFCIVKE